MLVRIVLAAAVVARAFMPGRVAPQRRLQAAIPSMDEGIVSMARDQASKLREMLGSTKAPAELEHLEAGIEASAADLGERMFELLITMTLDHVADPETRTIAPVESPGESLAQTPELQAKMQYLYSYGVRMLTSGLIDVDRLKGIVEAKMARRVGMSGEELDGWLDV